MGGDQGVFCLVETRPCRVGHSGLVDDALLARQIVVGGIHRGRPAGVINETDRNHRLGLEFLRYICYHAVTSEAAVLRENHQETEAKP